MRAELRHHETLGDRILGEGRYMVLIRPAIRATIGWTLFFAVLLVIAGFNRQTTPVMFCVPPVAGIAFGFVGTVLRVWCGRDLIVHAGCHLTINEVGRRGIHEPVDSVVAVNVVDHRTNRVTLQIKLKGPAPRTTSFTTSCSPTQRAELLEALAVKSRT